MEDQMDLPPGFRFHPTDEELITHYLCKKVIDGGFSPPAIGDVDLNKCEPWDLPAKAKMGEKERYFFCVRDRKYPTGLRTNRATKAGYWKATGKDKEIFRGKVLIGMKKTLVFYVGRAPKGEKSNWVMHEFRLEGKFSFHSLPKAAQNEWVISRVFQKSSCGKKTQITGMTKVNPFENSFNSSLLPPLMDSPPYDPKSSDPTNVPCFSSAMYFPRNPEKIIDSFDDGNNNPIFPRIHHLPNSSYPALETPIQGSWQQFQNPISLQGTEMHQGFKTEREMVSGSQETGVSTEANNEISSVIISNLPMGGRPFQDQAVPPEFDCLWNY